jgi:hypothetical protein
LIERRLRVARDWAERRGIVGNLAPAEDALSVVHHRRFEDRLVMATTRGIAREETGRDRVVMRRGERHPHRRELVAIKLVGNLNEHTRAVARPRIAARGAAMRQVGEDLEPLSHDRVRGLLLDGRDESEPASIVFERRIIESLTYRQRHRSSIPSIF